MTAGSTERTETSGTGTVRIDPTRASIQVKHSWDPTHRSALPGTEEQPRPAVADVREAAEPGGRLPRSQYFILEELIYTKLYERDQ